MRVDLHTHPLSHRYYYDGVNPGALSERDKTDIAGLLRQAAERGLDAVAVTDHDFALSGLWAREYARDNGLAVTVVAGCECELYYRAQYIHLLALNLREPLRYTAFTPPEKLMTEIRCQGGVSVLAHPMCYSPDIYESLRDVVDGVEYRNGAQERRGSGSYAQALDRDGYAGLRLYNSDYHYPDQVCPEQWNAFTEISEKEFLRLFGK